LKGGLDPFDRETRGNQAMTYFIYLTDFDSSVIGGVKAYKGAPDDKKLIEHVNQVPVAR
jgi:hypothetical protein